MHTFKGVRITYLHLLVVSVLCHNLAPDDHGVHVLSHLNYPWSL